MTHARLIGWPHAPSGKVQPFSALHLWRLNNAFKKPPELTSAVEITFMPDRIESATNAWDHISYYTHGTCAVLILTPEQATWLARKAGVVTHGRPSDEQRGARKLIEEEIMVKPLEALETDSET